MLSPKLIIFDLDGVLANTEHYYTYITSKALTAQGFTKYTVEYCEKNTTGVALPLILEKVAKEYNKPVDKEAFYKSITRDNLHFEDHIYIVDGVHEFLKNLKIPFCLASSSSLVQIQRTIKCLKLDNYFTSKTIFSCESLEKYKPHPAVYLEALNSMKVHPDCTIAIEDSISGVKAATGANIATIGFVGADYLKNRKKSHGDALLTLGAFTIKDNYKDIKQLLFNSKLNSLDCSDFSQY